MSAYARNDEETGNAGRTLPSRPSVTAPEFSVFAGASGCAFPMISGFGARLPGGHWPGFSVGPLTVDEPQPADCLFPGADRIVSTFRPPHTGNGLTRAVTEETEVGAAIEAELGEHLGPPFRPGRYDSRTHRQVVSELLHPRWRDVPVRCSSARAHAATVFERIAARTTEYPAAAHSVIPMGPGNPERAVAPDLQGLLLRLRTSDLHTHLLAESNRARYIRSTLADLKVRAAGLLTDIIGYQAADGTPDSV
jgi:hypothetical protein